MRVTNQAALRPSVMTLPNIALAAKYKTLTNRMLAWAGVSETASSLDRARAIVGWVAHHAVHPSTALHPNGSTPNLGVLPVGQTWATFNTEFDNGTNITRDNNYWFALYPNGMAMVEALVGTVSVGGVVTDNGMLTEYVSGAWRIRNFANYRAVQCTLQCKMAQVLLAAQGILSTDISTNSHDPMVFMESETGRWLYIDPTWGEMQRRNGEYMSPLDLVTQTIAGNATQITGQKLIASGYPTTTFFESPRLATGMAFMSMYANPQWSGGISSRTPYRFGNVPSQSDSGDISAQASRIMPRLGCAVSGYSKVNKVFEIRLRSNWPNHNGFQRSNNNGVSWAACAATEFVTEGAGQVLFRSEDAGGFSGVPAVILA